jgi:ABC-2 type transport system ATP-binding protein
MDPVAGHTLVRLDSISKRYGAVRALDRVSLRVSAGEIYALLGPNGAGKTTALLCLAGLTRPDAGRVEIDGVDALRQRRCAARALAFIPDQPYLPERLTVGETGEYALGLRGYDRRQAIRRLAPWLERFGLAEQHRVLVSELSHGMRQKLVFCLALAAETTVLVVDEPMVGLDVPAQRLVLAVLAEQAAAGRAVLVTTHTLVVAERLCQRVGILSHGRLLAEGTPEELTAARGRPDLEEVFLDLVQAGGGAGA